MCTAQHELAGLLDLQAVTDVDDEHVAGRDHLLGLLGLEPWHEGIGGGNHVLVADHNWLPVLMAGIIAPRPLRAIL